MASLDSTIRGVQERKAILDESEPCLFYGIRLSDGLAVIEREAESGNDFLKFRFEIVDPSRVRRISHDKFDDMRDWFAFVRENGL